MTTPLDLALSMYANEPCRVCGELVTLEQIKDKQVVYAGYSKCSASRSAHKKCWDENKPRAEWKYQ